MTDVTNAASNLGFSEIAFEILFKRVNGVVASESAVSEKSTTNK
jgi:hypothetical protein